LEKPVFSLPTYAAPASDEAGQGPEPRLTVIPSEVETEEAPVLDPQRQVALKQLLALAGDFVPDNAVERVAATLEQLFATAQVANPSGLDHLDLLARDLDASMARLRFLKDLAMVARVAHRSR
jgi:hypothetical protein